MCGLWKSVCEGLLPTCIGVGFRSRQGRYPAVRVVVFRCALLGWILAGIPTRLELGGLDQDDDGVSDEPLHSHGSRGVRKGVFVHCRSLAVLGGCVPRSSIVLCVVLFVSCVLILPQVDYMINAEKSMKPKEEAISLAVRELVIVDWALYSTAVLGVCQRQPARRN